MPPYSRSLPQFPGHHTSPLACPAAASSSEKVAGCFPRPVRRSFFPETTLHPAEGLGKFRDVPLTY